jgi:hypothetical protein
VDIVYLAAIGLFFGLTVALAAGCEKLGDRP